jgi:MoaA/NifB/PqqE/SkfB family radical SAM enzyme
MYGYKTNELKIPDLRSRQYWNYIKTINISIQGQMPEADRLRLCNIFDNGVTIWHDAYHFGDYSQNNH